MIWNPTVHEKISYQSILIAKACKNTKIQQKHKTHAPLDRGPQNLEEGDLDRGSDLFQGVTDFK